MSYNDRDTFVKRWGYLLLFYAVFAWLLEEVVKTRESWYKSVSLQNMIFDLSWKKTLTKGDNRHFLEEED